MLELDELVSVLSIVFSFSSRLVYVSLVSFVSGFDEVGVFILFSSSMIISFSSESMIISSSSRIISSFISLLDFVINNPP